VKLIPSFLKGLYETPPILSERENAFQTVQERLLTSGTEALQVLEWGTGAATAQWLSSKRVQRLVSLTTDAKRHEEARQRFAAEITNGRLELFHLPWTAGVTGGETAPDAAYESCHDFVMHPLHRHGEDAFDIVLVNTPVFATDCAEMSALIARDTAVILWTNVVSWQDGPADQPSGRRVLDVAGRFAERYYFDAHRTLILVNRKRDGGPTGLLFAEKRSMLDRIFEQLENAGIEFVLLRGADTIPAACDKGADIDMLIAPDGLVLAQEIFRNSGFTHQVDSVGGARLYEAQPHHHFYYPALEFHIDVVIGLHYTSLNRRDSVGVHRHLQASVIDRRRRTDDLWRYTPSVNDSLLHLLCRCIYDKQTCPPKYAAIIGDMFEAADNRTLNQELEGLFFRFAPCIEEIVRSGHAQDIPQRYLQFQDY
jgi:hypothetical protein